MNVEQIVESCKVERMQAKMLKEIWDIYKMSDTSMYEFIGHLIENELDINTMDYVDISTRFCLWGMND